MAIAMSEIDNFITEQMTLGHMPGLGIMVIKDDETVLERGYGFADMARQEAMTATTPVVIGSTTKALTAAAVLQLVDRGLLTLDDPIRTYLPEFQLADENAAAQVTIRQVLSHTAGLPPTPMDGPAFLFCDDMEPDASQRYLAGLSTAEPVWSPGSGWLYSNDGYVLAGRVIEAVSGLQYDEYMASNLFQPLGMQNTRFPLESAPEPGVATAYDYGPDGSAYPSFFPHNRASNAAGMLISSAHDAGRWLETLLRDGDVNGTRIISENSIREMMGPQAPIPAGPRASADGSVTYGFGWMLSESDGMRVVSHGGSAITMGSHFLLMPEERLAIAVVTNSSSETTGVIIEGVMRLLTGREPARSFPRVDPALVPDRSRWSRLAGTYRPLEPQNAVTSLLPIDVSETGLQARTYPGDHRRRAGDIHFAPLDNDLGFVLYGRGKTGGLARFEIDGGNVRCVLQGTPLVKIASRLHSGSVVSFGGR